MSALPTESPLSRRTLHPGPLLAPVLAAALALSACGPQEQPVDAISASDEPSATSPAPTGEPTSEDTSTADPTPRPSSTSGPALDDASDEPATTTETPQSADEDHDTARASNGDVPNLGVHCTMPVDELDRIDQIEFTAPNGWQIDDGCRFFDPVAEEVERNTEPDVAVSVRVSDVAFHEAVEPGPETRDEIRYVGARSGYQAVRIRAEATGRGLYPRGMPVLTHLVDLDPGTDDTGGTLVLSARPSSGADFALAAEALDRMFNTVLVRPAATDAAVVTRVEGGGTPWTVTRGEQGCLRLHAGGPDGDVIDQVCDLAAPDGRISGAVLGDDTLQVVAGLAPPRSTWTVTDAATAPYGAVTQPMEGAAAFAFTPVDVPVEVRALDVEGEQLATATLE